MRPRPTASAIAFFSSARWLIWRQYLDRYRQPLGLTVALLLFALAMLACRHLLTELDPSALHQSLLAVPRSNLFGALGLTVLGFIALLGYEWSASRYAAVHLPPRTLATGGFCAFAIGNAVGLSMLSGGSIRYRLYARHGLGTSDITRMTLFASLSLGCALPPLAALTACLDLDAASNALGIASPLLSTLSLLLLAVTCGFLLFLLRARHNERPAPDCVSAHVGRRALRLPGIRLSLWQLLITLVDVSAAAGVLYLLLPHAPPFSAFLLVYLLALAAGVLSHIPGGVGVFEAVLLGAFTEQLGAAPLAAALLLYRLLYIVLPLLLACLLLLAIELRRLLDARQAIRLASSLATPILALLVFISGMVLLFSGAIPGLDRRVATLSFLVPQQLIDASHFGASLVGLLCLLLAQGLRRRLSAAWGLTLVLLIAGAALSLLKGFDWEEALLLSITAILLALFRPYFYRTSRIMELPFSPWHLVASACVLGASVWLMFFVYQDIPYEHQLWWQFELNADAPRGLRAALGCALLFGVTLLVWLLRAAPPAITLPESTELDLAAAIVKASDQADGGLALSGDKALLLHPEKDAFIMYARRARSMVALFDPIGPAHRRAELAWQFRDLCDRHHARPVFYQVRAENLPLYVDIGLTAVKLGEEARVDLKRFDLENTGKAMKDLRYTWNRGQRDGLQLEFHAPGAVPLQELRAISDAWLGGKQMREKGFSLGRFEPHYLNRFRSVLVRSEGQAVAFANLLETDSHDLATLDLMRVLPDAPKLTMEFLMLGLILHFKQAGFARFSLGMVPLSGLQPRRGAPLTQRLGALVFQRGEAFYNFQGLRRFKEKFQPDWEPRYMAVPAGLDPLVALTDTAALIAGGFSGLVKR
jgi:phosphatidylglycerol lysyltransferase